MNESKKFSAEKAELWKKFASSGKIEDYLTYSRFNGEAGRDRSEIGVETEFTQR